MLGSTDEDRLNASLSVRSFRGTIEEITGPGGRSAETMTVVRARAEAFLRLPVITGAAISTAIGTFAGRTAGRAATALAGIAWMMPVTAAVTVMASLVLAVVRPPAFWPPRRGTRPASAGRRY